MRYVLPLLLAACPEPGEDSVAEVSTAVSWGVERVPCIDGRATAADPGALIVQVWAGPTLVPNIIALDGQIVVTCREDIEVRWIAR